MDSADDDRVDCPADAKRKEKSVDFKKGVAEYRAHSPEDGKDLGGLKMCNASTYGRGKEKTTKLTSPIIDVNRQKILKTIWGAVSAT